MDVGIKLEKWRRAAHLSQRAAAALAGVSQATIVQIERGQVRRIGLDVADAIVALTKGAITLDDFRGVRKPTQKRRAA